MTDDPGVPAPAAAPDVARKVAPWWIGPVLLALWSPVLVVGIVFTLSIVYALLGLPMLLLAWPTVSVGWRILRSRSYTGRRAVVGVVGAVLVAGLLVVFITPFHGDGLAWLAFGGGLTWCVAAWLASRAAARYCNRDPGGDRTAVRQ